MISGEGEEVDFSHPVSLDGPVEAWLADLENAMQVRNSAADVDMYKGL